MSTKYTDNIDVKISRKGTLVEMETFLEIIGLYMFYLILKEINKKRNNKEKSLMPLSLTKLL